MNIWMRTQDKVDTRLLTDISTPMSRVLNASVQWEVNERSLLQHETKLSYGSSKANMLYHTWTNNIEQVFFLY